MEWGSTTFGILRTGRRRAGDVAGEAASAGWNFRRRSTARWPAMRGWRGGWRRSCRSTNTTKRRFFCSDDAPEEIAARAAPASCGCRRCIRSASPKTARRTAEVADSISDLQFTDAYRVPFQYSRFVRRHLPLGAFVQSSAGVTVTDLDGNRVLRSYRLVRRQCVRLRFLQGDDRARPRRVRELGPVLGPYHPVVADNVRRLKEISGLDEVSFHMSGTEAVMQAVRLARYHTRRSHLVRFCGAYHGWWGDVQPGVGNPVPAHETYTLKDMSEDTLRVLRTRRDIACVLVNPLQALHPNAGAPADSSLVDSARTRAFRQERLCRVAQAAARGLHRAQHRLDLRRGVRRLSSRASGGAQEYFGVRADLVTYGKTLGGGLPIGVVCGRKDLMKRFRDDRPADICFARGTFNSHPYVMGAMHEFLRHLDTPQARELYRDLDESGTSGRSGSTSACGTKRCRCRWRTCPRSGPSATRSRRATTGCCNTTCAPRAGAELDRHRPPDLQPELYRGRLRRGRGPLRGGGRAMQRDGWWWSDPATTNKSIKRRILKEMIAHRFSSKRAIIHSPTSDAVTRQLARGASSASSSLHSACSAGIDQLAAQQIERRLVVELDVVERVGQDFRRPNQPGLDVLDEEQLHRAEQQPAQADDEPDLRDMAHEFGLSACGAKMPNSVGSK